MIESPAILGNKKVSNNTISEQLISLHTFRSNALAKKHKISVC